MMQLYKMAKVTRIQVSYQAQNRKFFLVAYFCGFYWPGVEQTLSTSQQWIFFSYSLIVSFLPVIQLIAVVIALITNTYPVPVIILSLRRILAMLPAAKLILHAIPSRRRQLEHLFDEWNYNINTGADRLERQEILERQMIMPKRMLAFTVIVGWFLAQLPVIAMLFNRNMRGANLAYIPHNPQAWYHVYLVGLQLGPFLMTNLAGQIFNYLILVLLAMAGTQLQLLRKNLDIICKNVVCDKESDKPNVKRQINDWVKDHQKTLIWLTALKKFLSYTSSIKFLFMGSYVCVAVFTMPNYIKQGSAADIMMLALYLLGSFPLNFYECRLADELYEKSGSLFDDAYDGYWSFYPRSASQSLSIIQTRSMSRPVQLKAFSILPDNSDSFMSVLGLAYKALSFLLQLDIF